MSACGVLGIIPRRPFENAQEFHAHVLAVYPVNGAARQRQVNLIVQASKEAEHGRQAAVIELIKRVRGLSLAA
jgi:hypothetical protein